jgi:hypothetical protein
MQFGVLKDSVFESHTGTPVKRHHSSLPREEARMKRSLAEPASA